MPDKARERLSEWLSENRSHYMEIRSKIEDPDRVMRLLDEIYRFMEPVLSITQISQPHEAMFAIGATKAGMEVVFEEIAFYHDYESKRGQMAQILGNDEGVTGVEEPQAHLDVTIQPAATQ